MSRGRKVTEAYPLQRLHKIFLVAAALFMVSMVWMFWDDYDRPWKSYQREFLLLQKEKKQSELNQIGKLATAVEKLDQEIAALESKLGDTSSKIGKLRQQIHDKNTLLGPAVQRMKFKKADVDSIKYLHDHAYAHYMHERDAKHDTAEALAQWEDAKGKLDAVREEFQQAGGQVNTLQQEIQKLEQTLEPLQAKSKDALRLASLLEKRAPKAAKLDGLRKQQKDLSTAIGFWLRNAPMLDMLNPNLKVKQVVLPAMKFNIFFADVQTVDRCMTCHLSIDKPGWNARTHTVTGQEYAELVQKHGPGFKPQLLKKPKSIWYGAQQINSDDALAGLVSDYGLVRIKKTAGKTQRKGVSKTEYRWLKHRWGKHLKGKKTKKGTYTVSFPKSATVQALEKGTIRHPFSHPFRSHPELGLYMGSTSPHPMGQFGCRSCHNGMARATDFVRATHTPTGKSQTKRWKEQYGWHMLHDKEWKKPQWPHKFVQSGCVACHADIVDLQPMPWTLSFLARKKSKTPTLGVYDQYSGRKVYEGRQLFVRNGCNGCHGVDSLKDIPKVGPSLAHVRSKLSVPWMRSWIEKPREFRPDTYMPHVFKVEHHLEQLEKVETTALDFGSLLDKYKDRPADGKKELKRLIGMFGKRNKLMEAVQDAEIDAVATYLHENSTQLALKSPAVAGNVAKGKGLFRDKGCLGCHKMDDFKLEGEPAKRFGPDLTQVGSKFAEGVGIDWLYSWLLDPRAYHRESRMPDPRLEPEEAAHLAAYLNAKRLPAKHEFLKSVADLEKPEENLVEMRLVTFLSQNMRPDQAWKIVGMLNPTVKRAWLGEKVISKQGCFGCHLMPEGTAVSRFIESNRALKDYLVANGLSRISKPIQFNGLPGIGTDLSTWGTKLMTKLDFGLRHDLPHTRWDFIVNKLQTPRMYDEGLFKLYDDMLRMPHFAMNQQDAEKIATFVMGHKTGKTAKRYLYKDTDANYRKRPWELEAQALKLNLGQRPPEAWSGTDRAAFAGMVERLTKATKARQETADADRLKKIGSSLAGLKPKNLSREDAQFVLGVQGRIEGRLAPQWLDASARRRAIIEGRKLILQFNCQGCHLIEGRGWELRDYMAKYPYPGLKKTDVNEASPPFLSQLRSESDYQARWRNFQGARTKAGWLFNFLRDPGSTIIGRPWLRVKMPNFHMTVQQANTLTRYFAALNGTAWPNAANDVPPSDEDYKIALSVFEKNDCFGCHRATPTPAPGKKGAPDLERAEARLRADWVQHWIYKPYQFIPFTAMPSGQIPSMEDAAAVTRVIMNRAAMRRLKTQFKIPLIK